MGFDCKDERIGFGIGLAMAMVGMVKLKAGQIFLTGWNAGGAFDSRIDMLEKEPLK